MREWWEREGPKAGDDRAFIEAFAEGSPGMAVRASEHGLSAWQRELWPLLDQLESGGFPPNLGDRMAEIADEFAKGIVDADENASKDAANRQAVRLLARLLGLRVRQSLARAGDDPAELSRWLGAAEVLGEFERHVRSNVNLKHAFANLAAQWAERTAPRAAGTARAR
jgi:hypothetical protein